MAVPAQKPRIIPRNRDLARLFGPLTDWQNLAVEVMKRGAGSWQLTTTIGSEKVAALMADGAGVIIELDDEYLLSGPVDLIEPDDSDGVQRVTISGVTDAVWLNRRRCRPCAAMTGAELLAYLINQLEARRAELTAEISVFQAEIAVQTAADYALTAATNNQSVISDHIDSLNTAIDDLNDSISNATLNQSDIQSQIDSTDPSDTDQLALLNDQLAIATEQLGDLNAQLTNAQANLALVTSEQTAYDAYVQLLTAQGNQQDQVVTSHSAQLAADQDELSGIDAIEAADTSRIPAEGPGGLELYYVASNYDNFAGGGEAAIKHYVSANLGPDAEPMRRLAKFSIADDHAFGSQTTQQARLTNLATFVDNIAATTGDLGYNIIQVGDELVFDVVPSNDVSDTMVFSVKRKNLKGVQLQVGVPDYNETLLGGSDDTSVAFVQAYSPDSIEKWGLIENDLQSSSASDTITDQLAAAADNLASAQETLALTFTASESEARGYRRGWDENSIVSVEVNGKRYTETIRSVKLTWDGQDAAPTVEPVVTSLSSVDPNVLAIFKTIAQLKARTSKLQVRR